MAFPSPLPWNPPLHLRPPPSPSSSPLFSSYPLLPAPQRHSVLSYRSNPHRIDAYISFHALQNPNEEDYYPQSQSQSATSEATAKEMKTKKKKKKKKLRPNFYDQTLERWSVKISSQRSRFPWQEKRSEEEENGSSFPIPISHSSFDLLEDSSATGKSIDPTLASATKFRSSRLDSESKSRLDLIAEKLNENIGDTNDDLKLSSERTSLRSMDENPKNANPVDTYLGIRSTHAPWVHGAKLRQTHLDSEDETEKGLADLGFEREEETRGGLLLNGNRNALLGQSKSNRMLDVDRTDCVDKYKRKSSLITEGFNVSPRDDVNNSIKHYQDSETTSHVRSGGHHYNVGSQQRSTSEIVEKLRNSMHIKKLPNKDNGVPIDKSGEGYGSDSDQNIAEFMGPDSLPWGRKRDSSGGEHIGSRKSNTELAERTIPENELRRLRYAALRMKERMKVGPAGVTEAVVESIHEKWREAEVVKLRFEGAPSLNMKRTHEILENKTGGLVIWRSGRSLVLFRGMSYELPCVQSYPKVANTESNPKYTHSTVDCTDNVDGNKMESCSISSISDAKPTMAFLNPYKGFTDTSKIDSLLDELGPRFKDWSGRMPVPVDADLLPSVVPGYKPPFRLLPYKTKRALGNRDMTYLRRLARTMPPHFALGRYKLHQGLASAMVKLWEKSTIAKIAIKRGIPNTSNERMAEEIKKLTGGTLLSRNKEYIVFYRGNDFIMPSIRDVLIEKQQLATVQQDEEELARLKASASLMSKAKASKGPLVAGTLKETVEANSRWGNPLSSKAREKMKKELTLAKHASLVRFLERKLVFAKAKVAKAEKALAKVQEYLTPAELPTDLETVTDEERFLFRKMGLKMRAFLLVGKRGVFDGTVQNMHLNWKHRELVKILVNGKNFAQVKHLAISLEAESGGVLISVDKTTKGYAIIVYRGKNYQRPQTLKPRNLLTRRQALARSIELQRREALNHHISNLRERIEMLKSQLDQMKADKDFEDKDLILRVDDALLEDDNVEVEGEEAYLETYSSGDEEDDAAFTDMA
ncbi:CRM-domain containing factor CFM3, chloroplastic/mitochondrial-like [Ananas comosus]|uniref:CRM-domain containing factor CFM3, chloroplastic/mitochondrial n=1 Tax=Ananas comosus TaxID=4615 RepID=A0A199VEG2_ANACO|nr:CRM-domain containing factor CFM3, chloroplastic/mitochondrial-like [Ananas comosus]OAY75408.1 Chloroplastic group IIA intron splicing facilitator CRS1, chloroplastic [Ananas comosus]